MDGFAVPALIKKVASGERTHKDLTRAEARWLMEQALSGSLSDVQLGALLAALRLKGETPSELAGFLEAVHAATVPAPVPRSDRPVVAHCGATSGKGVYFLASAGAALLAAAAGVGIVICGRAGGETKFTTTEIEVFRALGVPTDLGPLAVGEQLARTGIAVCEQRRFHPRLAALSDLRVPLGMRTVAQSVEKYVFPVVPDAALAGAFHLNYLRRLAEATASVFGFRLYMLQERDGAIDPRPVHASKGFLVAAGSVSEWEVSPALAGLETHDRTAFAPLDARETAERSRELLRGREDGPLADMLLYNAGLLIHAGYPDRTLGACVEQAREALRHGAGLGVLEQLQPLAIRR